MGKTKLSQVLLLEPQQLADLDRLARSSGTTRMALLREALADLLAKHGTGAAPPPSAQPQSKPTPKAEPAEYIYAGAQQPNTPEAIREALARAEQLEREAKRRAPKPRPKLTPEQVQADLARKFAEATTAKTYPFMGNPNKPIPTCCGIYLDGVTRTELRMVHPFSYIARRIVDGVSTYRRLGNYKAHAQFVKPSQTEAGMQAMRRRLRELHPDKSGREQTPEEREEATRLAEQLDEARAAVTKAPAPLHRHK
jgi:hypothetical protein